MKKLLIVLIVFISVSIVKAEIVKIDGLDYDLESSTQTASVSSGNEVLGAITIPETINYQGKTYSVTSIGDYVFIYAGALNVEYKIPTFLVLINY